MQLAPLAEELHTDALPLDGEAPAAGSWAARDRDDKAPQVDPAQRAANHAAAHAAADRQAADRDAAKLAELAAQPVPAYATWVFDSNTGEKVGYDTAYGVVLFPAPEVVEATRSVLAAIADMAADRATQPRLDLSGDPAPTTAVVIVPCGGAKAPGVRPAGEKYIGSYHRQTRKAAAAIAARTGATVLILSARYGLLHLDDTITDYDLVMGQPGAVTAATVAAQAAQLGITDTLVTVIAGRKYADVVTAVWPHAVRVLDGTGGMGVQMNRMAQIAAGTWTPEPPAAVAAVPALFGADLTA